MKICPPLIIRFTHPYHVLTLGKYNLTYLGVWSHCRFKTPWVWEYLIQWPVQIFSGSYITCKVHPASSVTLPCKRHLNFLACIQPAVTMAPALRENVLLSAVLRGIDLTSTPSLRGYKSPADTCPKNSKCATHSLCFTHLSQFNAGLMAELCPKEGLALWPNFRRGKCKNLRQFDKVFFLLIQFIFLFFLS